MKHGKGIIAFLASMIVVFASCLGIVINQRQEAIAKRDEAQSDYREYSAKKLECNGYASTTNKLVNSAGLTDCGGDIAVDARLTVTSLYNIYHNYCYSGFGVRVYGCYLPSTGRIYVCNPGSTLYDRKWINWYSYYYIKYACNDTNISNVIRHELLHVVYDGLTYADKINVDAKLAKYENAYWGQISSYSSDQRNGELFVRVGADGRHVDDIELIDLYSKVSRAYVAQKQNYYGNLMATADRYVDKYSELNRNYTVLMVVLIASIGVTVIVLAVVASKSRKKHSEKKEAQRSIFDIEREKRKAASLIDDDDDDMLSVIDLCKAQKKRELSVLDMHKQKKPKVRSIFDPDFEEVEDDDEEEFEELREKIDSMGKKKSKTKTKDDESERKKFEDFKKKYGIIDVEDDDF